jgi:hypothetical protein
MANHSLNRHLAICSFEVCHAEQLIHAQEALRFSREHEYWIIALWHPLDTIPPDDIQVISTIRVKLDDRGQLMTADDTSERAVDEWEKKYATSGYLSGQEPKA